MPSSTTAPAREGADATTGATTRIGFFAPDAALPRRPARRRRVQGDGRRACTTPASRSSSTWSTTTPPKATSSGRRCRSADRQRHLLPAAARPAALLHQRHRHRQHAEPEPSAGAADGDRQPALLGDGDARRRLPLRPGHHPRRASRTASTSAAASSMPAARIRCWPGQADRRALGLRPGRLSGRRLSAGLGRVERPLSATRCARSGRATTASCRSSPPRLRGSADLFDQRGRKPWASVNFVTAHDGFTLHDLVSLQRQAQRGQRRGQPATATRNNRSWNCGVEGPTDDPAITRAARAAEAQPAGHAAAVAGHADAAGRRRVRPHPAAATTTPIARTTRSAGSTGTLGDEGRALIEFVRKPDQLRQALSDPAPQPLPDRRLQRGARVKDVTWLTPDGAEMKTESGRTAMRRCFGMLLDGRAQDTGIAARTGRDAAHGLQRPSRRCPVHAAGGRRRHHWLGLIDTAQPEAPPATHSFGTYDITGRSLCAFALEGAATRDLRQGVGSILHVTERPLE